MSPRTTKPTVRLPQQSKETESEIGVNREGQFGAIHTVLRHPLTAEGVAVTAGWGHGDLYESRPHEQESRMSTATNIRLEPSPQGQPSPLKSLSNEEHLNTIAHQRRNSSRCSNSISTRQHLDTLDWIRLNRTQILAEGSVNQYGATIPGGSPQEEQDSKIPTLAIPAFRTISPYDQSLDADAGSGNSGLLEGSMRKGKTKRRSHTQSTLTRGREIPANEPAAADISHKNNKRNVSVKKESLSNEGSIRDASALKTSKRVKGKRSGVLPEGPVEATKSEEAES